MFQSVKVGYLSLERLKLSLLQVAGVLFSKGVVRWPLAFCYSAQLTNIVFAIFARRKGTIPSWLTKAAAVTTLSTLGVALWAWTAAPVYAGSDLILTMPILLLLPLNLTVSEPHPAGKLPGESPAMVAMSLLFIAVTVLVSPNGGGLQWGPRYLLVTAGPLSLVAAETVSRLWASRDLLPLLRAAIVCALVLGLAVQGMGLSMLRQHRLCADAVERAIPPGETVVTDEKMIPYQFTPFLLGKRRILLVDSVEKLEALRQELARKGDSEVLYITWTESLRPDVLEAVPRQCRGLRLIGKPVLSRLEIGGGR